MTRVTRAVRSLSDTTSSLTRAAMRVSCAAAPVAHRRSRQRQRAGIDLVGKGGPPLRRGPAPRDPPTIHRPGASVLPRLDRLEVGERAGDIADVLEHQRHQQRRARDGVAAADAGLGERGDHREAFVAVGERDALTERFRLADDLSQRRGRRPRDVVSPIEVQRPGTVSAPIATRMRSASPSPGRRRWRSARPGYIYADKSPCIMINFLIQNWIRFLMQMHCFMKYCFESTDN